MELYYEIKDIKTELTDYLEKFHDKYNDDESTIYQEIMHIRKLVHKYNAKVNEYILT